MEEFFNEIITVPKELKVKGSTIYWLKACKSSDIKKLKTSKKYLCIWKMDETEGIWWGDMDDLEMMNFKEKGEIIDSDLLKKLNFWTKAKPLGEIDKSAHLPIN